MVIVDSKKFAKASNSNGTIYLFPARSFHFYDNKVMGIYEWVSKEKVALLAKFHFSSALQDLNTLRVNIYFLEKAQFKFYLSLSADKQEKFLANFKQC